VNMARYPTLTDRGVGLPSVGIGAAEASP